MEKYLRATDGIRFGGAAQVLGVEARHASRGDHNVVAAVEKICVGWCLGDWGGDCKEWDGGEE